MRATSTEKRQHGWHHGSRALGQQCKLFHQDSAWSRVQARAYTPQPFRLLPTHQPFLLALLRGAGRRPARERFSVERCGYQGLQRKASREGSSKIRPYLTWNCVGTHTSSTRLQQSTHAGLTTALSVIVRPMRKGGRPVYEPSRAGHNATWPRCSRAHARPCARTQHDQQEMLASMCTALSARPIHVARLPPVQRTHAAQHAAPRLRLVPASPAWLGCHSALRQARGPHAPRTLASVRGCQRRRCRSRTSRHTARQRLRTCIRRYRRRRAGPGGQKAPPGSPAAPRRSLVGTIAVRTGERGRLGYVQSRHVQPEKSHPTGSRLPQRARRRSQDDTGIGAVSGGVSGVQVHAPNHARRWSLDLRRAVRRRLSRQCARQQRERGEQDARKAGSAFLPA